MFPNTVNSQNQENQPGKPLETINNRQNRTEVVPESEIQKPPETNKTNIQGSKHSRYGREIKKPKYLQEYHEL